jgi:RimJ/RimL family protein N-acetyltransferase
MLTGSWQKIPTLKGDFVSLRPTVVADAEALAQAYDDPGTFEYFPYGVESAPPSPDTLAHVLNSGRQTLTVVDRSRATVIGTTSIYNLSELHGRVTFGYTWLSAEVRGSACNAELKMPLLQHVFGALGASRAEFYVDNLNLRSQRALTAIGAVEEGRLRRHARRRDGSLRTTVVYSVVDEDWPAVENQLRELIARRTASIGAATVSGTVDDGLRMTP